MAKKLNRFLYILFFIFFCSPIFAENHNFDVWLSDFKEKAIAEGISKETVTKALSKAKYIPKVIEYDRYQPEFYEDTKTYISKRTNKNKVRKGLNLYKEEKKLINTIEENFLVEKELLLALMGIETNYGKYLGKMDIISSLATLSFDKRRSEFFTSELLILLKLIDDGIIDPSILFGSWAGAFGYFQFMPSTIDNYAIDFNENSIIELKDIEDSFASAANYLNLMGWKKKQPCFVKVDLKSNIPEKYLNTSAQKIKYKKKLKYYKKYLNNFDDNFDDSYNVAIITPDSDIVDNAEKFNPAYIVFENYELILKWNRSLRFALAVCTLKEKFENEI